MVHQDSTLTGQAGDTFKEAHFTGNNSVKVLDNERGAVFLQGIRELEFSTDDVNFIRFTSTLTFNTAVTIYLRLPPNEVVHKGLKAKIVVYSDTTTTTE